MVKTITNSMIRAFKSCRRMYELEYIENLKPVKTPEALEMGASYHNYVEKILKNEDVELEGKTGVMAKKFKKIILPKLPKIKEVEKEFKVGKIIGKIDAIAVDGTPIEHKTTGYKIDEKYIYKLSWDEQVTTYLLALSLKKRRLINKMIYTVIMKPSIRLKQNETEEEYLKRCEEWYNEDTEHKVSTFSVVRSKEELEQRKKEIRYIVRDIKNCKMFYRNPNHCMFMGCKYSSICLDYNPEFGCSEFEKKTKRNEELDENFNS